MTAFRDWSLRHKLVVVMTATAIVSLLVAFAALVVYDQITSRAQLVRDVSSLATVVGSNSTAALTFDDRRVGAEVLDTLRVRPNVVRAYLYTPSHAVFAAYSRDRVATTPPRPPESDAYTFAEGNLRLFQTIRQGTERVGTVFIEADTHALRARVVSYFATIAVLILISAIGALLLSDRMQQVISRPILHLAAAADSVSRHRDYSVRVPLDSKDEIGELTTAFNEMLEQIQTRDAALKIAHDELQDRVQQLQVEITQRETTQAALRKSQQDLRRLAFYDQLTGLPNRSLLIDRLDLALLQAQRNETALGVLFIDVDRFKLINDTLGHTAGDELLCAVANRIRASLRRSDTVARLGGDEFVVILPALSDLSDAGKVAEKILQALSHPFCIGDQQWFVTVSVGISVYPPDGSDAETLIKNADAAMYRAKERGRDGFEVYTHDLHVRTVERVTIETELRSALDRNEFLLHYQPIVDFGDGTVRGAEALVRWQHPHRGMVSPAQFIPIAEETGLIVPIGRWVLNQACSDARQWQIRTGRKLRIAVNLAARQFQLADLADQVAAALDTSALEPSLLDLEITESSAMQNTEQTASTMRRLKEIGVRLSIDDFGTGYSSLASLRRFPIDTLKIDRSFVKDLPGDVRNAALVEAIIALGHGLQFGIVAEGVETAEQYRRLKENGCDAFQGFLFSRPVPCADLCDLLIAAPATELAWQ